LELLVELGGGLFRERRAVGYEYRRGEPVVLGLGEHVRREPGRVRCPVRDYEYLARPGYHIYRHLAEHLALRLRDEGVAGADYLVHPGYGLRPVSQGRTGPRPADAEHPVHSRDLRRSEDGRAD